MSGFIFYQGPSVLDGQPIVGIVTTKTTNRKTGNIAQTWILRADQSPLDSVQAGADSSVCGSCPLRHSVGGSCYVNLSHGPRAVYGAFKRGVYGEVSLRHIGEKLRASGLGLRLGSYGDPAAVPFNIWDTLTKYAKYSLGYTHQIRHKNFDKRMLSLCMVSTETPKQTAAINAENLRTFRVVESYDQLMKGEIICPSESGSNCAECRLCNGADKKGPNVAILVHGVLKKRHRLKFSNVNKNIIVAE